MAIILRLQGLDVKAGTEDIRSFFEFLHIPDGGVYILGGSLREAFIAFNTERDAQLAMRLTGNVLKGSPVSLHISSMAEMELKLKSLLKKKEHLRPTRPLDPRKLSLATICSVLQGLQSFHQGENETKADPTAVSDEVQTQEQSLVSSPGYVRLFGLPASTTKDDICQFFRGLTVQEVIVNVKLGISHGCLVKFANMQDASDALLFNQHQLGNFTVEVRGATEKMWTSALHECENALDDGSRLKPNRSPFRETPNHKPPSVLWMKRGPISLLSSKSAKKPKCDDLTTIWPTKEYIVKVSNLPPTMTKTEIKELFGCPTIPHKHVLHFLDQEGNRTDVAFIIFKCTADYDYAINLDGCHVGSAAIEVTSITRFMMRKMMAKTHPRSQNHTLKMAQTCLFVRNMPADVQESQIRSLFFKYKLAKENIFLLRDSDGRGIGEAVVQFKSPKHASLAQRLHRRDFLGSEVLLTPINGKQMKDILGQEMLK
uniref:RNA binding motif protein 12Ba n=1 Tax=Labrus bergylta TaxID=56723 RepID=A0A3Q3L398_9LABR